MSRTLEVGAGSPSSPRPLNDAYSIGEVDALCLACDREPFHRTRIPASTEADRQMKIALNCVVLARNGVLRTDHIMFCQVFGRISSPCAQQHPADYGVAKLSRCGVERQADFFAGGRRKLRVLRELSKAGVQRLEDLR
ncbi:MAG: hypothetical protein KF805_10845 [Phycisphaeraceae bacterium]|nr:hypothetical protein [Phycisphaeraceae bacterium]